MTTPPIAQPRYVVIGGRQGRNHPFGKVIHSRARMERIVLWGEIHWMVIAGPNVGRVDVL